MAHNYRLVSTQYGRLQGFVVLGFPGSSRNSSPCMLDQPSTLVLFDYPQTKVTDGLRLVPLTAMRTARRLLNRVLQFFGCAIVIIEKLEGSE